MRRNAAGSQGRLDKAGAIGVKPLAYLEAHLNELPPALARAAIYVVENPEKVTNPAQLAEAGPIIVRRGHGARI